MSTVLSTHIMEGKLKILETDPKSEEIVSFISYFNVPLWQKKINVSEKNCGEIMCGKINVRHKKWDKKATFRDGN